MDTHTGEPTSADLLVGVSAPVSGSRLKITRLSLGDPLGIWISVPARMSIEGSPIHAGLGAGNNRDSGDDWQFIHCGIEFRNERRLFPSLKTL
jgi:hypothetical protein